MWAHRWHSRLIDSDHLQVEKILGIDTGKAQPLLSTLKF